MQFNFTINIEKRHFVILAVLIAFAGVMFTADAADVSTDLPFHSLQQVAKSSSDKTSVDENENGRIDWADNVSWSGVQSKPGGFADNVDHYLPQNPASSNVDMNSNRITDLQNPANPQDAATRSWVNTNDEYLPENPASSNVNMDGNDIYMGNGNIWMENHRMIGHETGGPRIEFENGGIEIEGNPSMVFGDGPPTRGLDMGGYKIQNLQNPDNAQEAATKDYVDDNNFNPNNCRICIRVYNNGNADTRCVDFNDGWSGWAGDYCGGSGCGEGTKVRVRVDC